MQPPDRPVAAQLDEDAHDEPRSLTALVAPPQRAGGAFAHWIRRTTRRDPRADSIYATLARRGRRRFIPSNTQCVA